VPAFGAGKLRFPRTSRQGDEPNSWEIIDT
jgi:hypothetical protein